MNNEYSKTCGEQIKILRESKRMSLREVAQKAELSHVALMNYENGLRSMNIDQINSICLALNVNTLEFLDHCFELVNHL